MDVRNQLTQLRRTVDGINARYATHQTTPKPPIRESFIEDLLSGEVVRTPRGRHFETEKIFKPEHRHGSYEISALADLRTDLLNALSDGEIADIPPQRWLFLDTETTGMVGGSGTCAFLIGVGSIDYEGFRVRQFFMRDYGEEASALSALAEYMERFDVLVTYNGRAYDQPLLENRYALCRVPDPFAQMRHLDLLYGARRLFRLRLENCRLVNLENEILAFERLDDIPGEMIPYTYFEYLRTHRAHGLQAVLRHNVLDIVSLACLTGVIPEAFRDPLNARARHGTDLLGLARWLQTAGRLDEALGLLRRAIDLGLPDQHLFAALHAAGLIEKKQGRIDAALATFTDLSLSPNPFRVRAYEELAMYYEHRERSFSMALECVRAARQIADSDGLRRRYERLRAKSAGTSRKLAPQNALTAGLL